MIAATVDMGGAAQTLWDAVVVGAGPAGSLAARELARRGRSVLLVDRAAFPRRKVCGCCLNGSALATLRQVGLGGLTAHCGAVPVEHIRLAAGARSALVPLAGGVALSREAFDAALVGAAIEAGAAFLPRTCGEWVGGEPGTGLTLRLRQNDADAEVRARVALAADGLGGSFLTQAPPVAASRIAAGLVTGDAPAFYQPGTIFMACGEFGYMGLVRLEDGRLDLAAALNVGWMRQAGGPGAAGAQLLASVGWPAPADLAHQPWRGTTALTRSAPQVAADGVFTLGDAAGYVEPFTGEGMTWALAAAVAVAPLADRAAVAWQSSLEREWEQVYRRVVRRRQLTCRAAAAVLRRPWLTHAVVALLAHWPRLACPIVYHLNSRTTRPAVSDG
jgi:menaquinone-9 beta-reductase